ncbi:MAG: YraN family protein [Vicinamibacterales bacterium]
MTLARMALGKAGEDLACHELERRGYAVLARRYRNRTGELDIVARDGPTIVFVEVKARAGSEFGAAEEAVTALKRRRIINVALDYLARHRLFGRPCRFDVVSVRGGSDGPSVEVITNAFSID